MLAAGASTSTLYAHEPENAPPAHSLLEKYCVMCHAEDTSGGRLSLSDHSALTRPEVWSHIRRRLVAGEMPPAEAAQPTAEERRLLLTHAETLIAGHRIEGQPDPGPWSPRRLNVRELRNMFRDLAVANDRPQPRKATYATKPDGTVNLYHAVIPPPEHPCAFVARVLPGDTQDGGFDAIGENLSIPPFLLEKYFRASKLLLDECFSPKGKDEHGRYRWRLRELIDKAESGPLPRGVDTRREGVARFLQEFASRAFRRPTTPAELESYLSLFDKSQAAGDDFQTSIRLSLTAILVSPRFAILWSDSAPPVASSEATRETRQIVRPLDDYELAARLAIFLWSSVPDRTLTELAEQGKLQDEQTLQQQVRRMIGDQRILDGFHQGFLTQWLQLDRLDRNSPDAQAYPEYFRDNLGELMKQELLLFSDAVLVQDRSILEFLDADWGFLCHPLAQHYGVDNFPGKAQRSNAEPPWYRVTFADRRRGGVLTMGKVLAGASHPRRTSPVHRGKWVLETLLGAPPPPPPPEVDNVLKEQGSLAAQGAEGKGALTTPQLMALHRSQASCHGCHRRIDPLGVALENFDPVGRWRETDQGQPVDASGELADGAKFNGVIELKDALLARKEEFVRCFAEQLLTYALGRKLEFYDAPAVDQLVAATVADDYKLSRVIVETAKSYPFRHRRAIVDRPAASR